MNAEKQNAGSKQLSLWNRLQSAWRAFWSPRPSDSEPVAPPAGLVLVKARSCFNKDRMYRLIGVRGQFVVGQSSDENTTQVVLLSEAQVYPEYVPVFRDYLKSAGLRGFQPAETDSPPVK